MILHELVNFIFEDLGLNLQIINLNKNYITVTTKDRKFMKHYKIKDLRVI